MVSEDSQNGLEALRVDTQDNSTSANPASWQFEWTTPPDSGSSFLLAKEMAQEGKNMKTYNIPKAINPEYNIY